MRGGLWDDDGVATLERLTASERASVLRATLFRSMLSANTSCGGISLGPMFVESCCALGCVESCRSGSHNARIATREDVGAVGIVGTGLGLAASEVVQDCCQGIEAERHCVRGRE